MQAKRRSKQTCRYRRRRRRRSARARARLCLVQAGDRGARTPLPSPPSPQLPFARSFGHWPTAFNGAEPQSGDGGDGDERNVCESPFGLFRCCRRRRRRPSPAGARHRGARACGATCERASKQASKQNVRRNGGGRCQARQATFFEHERAHAAGRRRALRRPFGVRFFALHTRARALAVRASVCCCVRCRRRHRRCRRPAVAAAAAAAAATAVVFVACLMMSM